MLTPASIVAVIGFGATGQRIATPLARRGVALRAHDLLLDASSTHSQMRALIEGAGVDPASTQAAALRGARLVIAAVGAAASSGLAESVAPQLCSGQIYLDLSDVSSEAHLSHAALIERSGAHYVAGNAGTVLLLAGRKASPLAAALDALGLPARSIADAPQRCNALQPSAEGFTPRWQGDAAAAPLRCELP